VPPKKFARTPCATERLICHGEEDDIYFIVGITNSAPAQKPFGQRAGVGSGLMISALQCCYPREATTTLKT
jgi:hypothetical protein